MEYWKDGIMGKILILNPGFHLDSVMSKIRDCFAPLAMTNPNAVPSFSRCEESFGDEATSFWKTSHSQGIALRFDQSDFDGYF